MYEYKKNLYGYNLIKLKSKHQTSQISKPKTDWFSEVSQTKYKKKIESIIVKKLFLIYHLVIFKLSLISCLVLLTKTYCIKMHHITLHLRNQKFVHAK